MMILCQLLIYIRHHLLGLYCKFFLFLLLRDASTERGDVTVIRPSVCLSVCLSVCNDQVPCSNRLEFFENNFTAE